MNLQDLYYYLFFTSVTQTVIVTVQNGLIIIVKCSDLNKEETPELVDTRGSCRRFSIFEK